MEYPPPPLPDRFGTDTVGPELADKAKASDINHLGDRIDAVVDRIGTAPTAPGGGTIDEALEDLDDRVTDLEDGIGAPDGIAPLDSGGKVPLGMLPGGIGGGSSFPAANQAAMLALSSAVIGDVAVRADLDGVRFMLLDADYTQLSSWQELNDAAGPVSSVDGQTGAVDLSGTYAGLAATTAALAARAPIDSPTFTGTPKAPTPTGGSDAQAIATKAYVQAQVAAASTARFPFVVAAADSPDEWKDIATAICSGTDDQVEIQAVVDACAQAGAGLVVEAPGTYFQSERCKARGEVMVEGFGAAMHRPMTELASAATYPDPRHRCLWDMSFNSSVTDHSGFPAMERAHLAGLILDGVPLGSSSTSDQLNIFGIFSESSQDSNPPWLAGSPDICHRLSRLIINRTAWSLLHVQKGSGAQRNRGWYIDGIRSFQGNRRNNASQGSNPLDSHNPAINFGGIDSHIQNLDIGSWGTGGRTAGAGGIKVAALGGGGGNDNMLANCRAWLIRDYGFYLDSGSSGIIGGSSHTNYGHGYWLSAAGVRADGINAYDNSNGAAGTYHGVYIDADCVSVAAAMSRNQDQTTQGYGYYLAAGVEGCSVQGVAEGNINGLVGYGGSGGGAAAANVILVAGKSGGTPTRVVVIS